MFTIHRVVLSCLVLSAAHALAQSGVGRAYLWGSSGSVQELVVIDTQSEYIHTSLRVSSVPSAVAVSPDGTTVYMTNLAAGTVSVMNASSYAIGASIPVGAAPEGVAVSPDGSRVFVTNYASNSVSVIDAGTDTVIAAVQVGSYPIGVIVSPDGGKVYVANSGTGSVSVIDTAANQVTNTIPVASSPASIAITPDGTRVYAAGRDAVAVIDTASATGIASVPVPTTFGFSENSTSSIAMLPNGTKLYVTNGSSTLSVIDTRTNSVTATIGLAGPAFGIAVTPDGTKVFVNNNSNTPVVVIYTASDTVTDIIPDLVGPFAPLGAFIGPLPVPPGPPTINPASPVDPWTVTTGISPGAWVAIIGTNFKSGNPVSWTPQPGQPLATTLGGVTVLIDGIEAPISYASSNQANVLVPAGVSLGQVALAVARNGVPGPQIMVSSMPFLPAIYSNPIRGSVNKFEVTAVDPVTGEYLGKTSVDPRARRGAHPGETIDLYAIGLGPTTPQFPTGTDFTGALTVASNFVVRLGGISLTPSFAALVSPGLYQVRIVVPDSMPTGDQPILIDFGTSQSVSGVYLAIQQ